MLTIQPAGNASSSYYDERDLVFESTRGALGPPQKVLLSENDPTDYDVRGGLASTTTYRYDGNGNLIRQRRKL